MRGEAAFPQAVAVADWSNTFVEAAIRWPIPWGCCHCG